MCSYASIYQGIMEGAVAEKKMKNLRRPGPNGQNRSRDKGEEERDKENQVYMVDFEMFFT